MSPQFRSARKLPRWTLSLCLLLIRSSQCFCEHQQWFWIFYAKSAASWLPTAFKGAVVRGPDIGASPSFLAMGRTNSSSYDGSTLVGYLDSGTLISYASNLFENAKRAISLLDGVVAAADFNYDGCTDAFLSGYFAIDNSLKVLCSQGTAPGRSGSNRLASRPYAYGAAVVRDFDHDGRLEYFATGVVDATTCIRDILLSLQSDGIPENVSSNLPPLLGLRTALSVWAQPAGATSTTFMLLATTLGHFAVLSPKRAQRVVQSGHRRSNRNGSSFFGSCAFASGAGGANASAWMDIFSVGQDSSSAYVFNYMKNNRNGTFTNLVNSSAAFPGGVPTGCYYSSMVAADLNGDGRDDLFYNG
jgi:hypothetical protein